MPYPDWHPGHEHPTDNRPGPTTRPARNYARLRCWRRQARSLAHVCAGGRQVPAIPHSPVHTTHASDADRNAHMRCINQFDRARLTCIQGAHDAGGRLLLPRQMQYARRCPHYYRYQWSPAGTEPGRFGWQRGRITPRHHAHLDAQCRAAQSHRLELASARGVAVAHGFSGSCAGQSRPITSAIRTTPS